MRLPSLGTWEKNCNEGGALGEDSKVPVWGHNQGGEQQWLPVSSGTHREANLQYWAHMSHLRAVPREGKGMAGEGLGRV